MVLDLLSRWDTRGLLLESPAEEHLAALLEAGPGTDTRAVFATAPTWRQALLAVSKDATAFVRCKLMIFPQVHVGRYRVDFLVVAARPRRSRVARAPDAFIIECDGRVGHAESADQVIADRRREIEIRSETGMDVLRFSGAEALYQSREVFAVIGAQVEAMCALRDFGNDAVGAEALAVFKAVSYLSAHRALRTDYTLRNSERRWIEPYDPADPFGEDGISAQVEREAEWDGFLAMRTALARLRHVCAYARRTAPDCEADEADGELTPISEVLRRHAIGEVLANVSRT